MKRVLDVELEIITDLSPDLSPLELASRVAPIVREAIEAMGSPWELEFDIFLVLDGCDVRFVVEPV